MYVFDEVSSFLDVKQRLAVADAVRSLVADDSKYVIVVEHDLAVLDYLAEQVCAFLEAQPDRRVGSNVTGNTLEAKIQGLPWDESGQFGWGTVRVVASDFTQIDFRD